MREKTQREMKNKKRARKQFPAMAPLPPAASQIAATKLKTRPETVSLYRPCQKVDDRPRFKPGEPDIFEDVSGIGAGIPRLFGLQEISVCCQCLTV